MTTAEATEVRPVTLVTSDGERLEFGCAPGRSVLEAAAEAGAALPASCKQGTCGSCHASVAEGDYELGAHSPAALPPERRAAGEVLLCRTFPRGPLSVTLPYDGSRILRGGIPRRQAVIVALETVACETVRLELRAEPTEDGGTDCQFDPGQFVELQVPGHDAKRAYSLANTGNWEGRMEFYIRLRPGGLFSTYLRERARPGQTLTAFGPQGAFGLRETGLRPRWFVAGGTGLAPLLSMVRHMAEWQEPQPARLLLGVNTEEEVFGTAELDAVAAELPGFSHRVCVWRPGPSWQGPVGTPADLLAADLAEAPAAPDIYVCGPPPMVDAVVQVAARAGVPAEHVFYERFLPT
ncbi:MULTISPECIES: 2Fe-2S iron-sulfur cluster-binding protein [Thermomonospora]|uniref:Oxidoreductase FAD/NAD(P)-binding domain protein n=1 Tax=Thermomonospora curvata (strain ATCC 19995 / DSM 43183 / JCM 3096 / KCTC 9072 / NBRC 15933 / NCIMB 10081 / Henssen B9) TaxID=471852 RepID=D1A2I5_THECD|nr:MULTISPECIES: 2Fe-2S iron-sulfur cluster binding domain-containing protein [Thermomonospora]ACY96005.1 oxidoreductase FAD/NAD(P)-binding domain protein [Thermomonospora curvata DSM 43183]PKK16039.1 MAG: oxidoreductase [Thermomonospora sp. CIF 1]